jgi:broad specificity phosphatase PhoE
MAKFYLIRHAERSGDPTQLVARASGVHLTAAGRAAAERLARHLAREPIGHVISSPLERTRETAEPLARQKSVSVEFSDAIGEVDGGAWAGRTFSDLDAGEERWRQFNQFRSATRIPGGEAMVEVQARFVGEMLRLRDAYPHDGIALVSHADPIKIALACFLGAPLDFFHRIEISLGSVSVVELDGWSAKILRLNDVPTTEPQP